MPETAGADELDLDSLGLDDAASGPSSETAFPEAGIGDGDFDFSAFLDSIPDDLPAPAVEDNLPGGGETAETGEGADDFDIPGGLLSGLSDELEASTPDSGLDLGDEGLDLGGEAAGEGFELGDSGLDLGGESLDAGDETGGLDLGGESLDAGDETGGLDLGGEAAGEGFELGDSGLDLGGEGLDADGETGGLDLGGEAAGESFGLDDSGLDLGGEGLDLDSETGGLDLGGEAAGESFGLDDSGLDLGGEGLDLGSETGGLDLGGEGLNLGNETGGLDLSGEGAETAGEPESFDQGSEISDEPAGDSFDSFNPGGQDTGAADFGGDTDGGDLGDEFSLSGIDDLFDEKPKTAKAAPGPKPKARRKAQAAEAVPEEVEEIHLSEADLENLRKTLTGYPLNLRIACEELIVEQAVAPDQMSRLIKFLVNGAPAKETAALAGEILGKTIVIPKGFEKSTGEALEAEQASFAYIFVHNFLPALRLFVIFAAAAGSLFYLGYQFIYTPLKAENIYKIGYERIFAGEYERANERFREAFGMHRKKDWFYKYAEGFRDERRYTYAEKKYDELLAYYPRDKKGILDYAVLRTYYQRNYEKADELLRRELLDYAPDDPEGLLALGDNSLAWGDDEKDPSRYEEARFAYARLLEKYGWTGPVVERMMKYFIRTDNLKEVLPLYAWFMNSSKRNLSPASMAELGGYLLDKQLEESRGVPDEYAEKIEGVRNLLLQAVRAEPSLPESHYHLARYYHSLGNVHEERITLENAIRAFDYAKEESILRLNYRIDAHRRYANILINNREFFPAEEQLVKGINLYEDALSRGLMARSPQYGRLYAGLGDLEYFTKNKYNEMARNMEMALTYYHRAEQNGWAPPEIQYRMGAAYYQLEDWKNALGYFFKASANLPLNRKLLYALGNAALKRGDYFAAQGYYNRLLDTLEAQRSRLPILLPNDRPEFLELGERIMMARNNAAVAYEALAAQTGDRRYRSRALALYAESTRAWDAIHRNPASMVRLSSGPNAPGISLPFLNARNALASGGGYEPEIFPRIDRDVLDPSIWEQLVPGGFEPLSEYAAPVN
jgi:tetratricopeptide (TPR) repeat protein